MATTAAQQMQQGSATAGDESSSPLPAAVFRRSASVASVEQSFLDPEPVARQRNVYRLDCSGGSGTGAAPTAAASPFPMPPLRPLHGRVRSNTQQDFFDDATDVPPASAPADGPKLTSVCRGETRDALPQQTTSSPSPAPLTGLRGVGVPQGERRDDGLRQRRTSVKSIASPQVSPPDTLDAFTRQYEHSGNPYLRAAANEMKITLDPSYCAAGSVPRSAAKVDTNGHRNHKPPQLTRPLAHHSHATPPVGRETLASSHADAADPVQPTRSTHVAPLPLRGIPLFAHSRRASGPSPASCAASLRQSLEDYGQLQLQEEAVHWYHRCSELEHTVARLAEAYDHQSKMLAAPWRCAERNEGTASTPPVPAASPAADAGCRETSLSATEGVMTSRSPDSLAPAYMTECAVGEVIEAGRASLQGTRYGDRSGSTEERGSAMPTATTWGVTGDNTASTDTRYAIPRPLSAAAEAVGATCTTVRRGGADVATMCPAHVTTTPPSTSSVGVQTDAPSEASRAFIREGGDSAHIAAADLDSEALPLASSPAPPSAIMARQYAEAVGEVDTLRVRLDVAEREAQNLREMCVKQDLRCDDLETQLLAKAEQLSHYTQPPQSEDGGSDDDTNGGGEEATSGSYSVRPAQLTALIAQLRDGLQSIQRVESEVVVEGVVEEDGARDAALPLSDADSSRDEERVASGADDHVVQLEFLVGMVQSAVLRVAQRHAALRAELEVVRADRNELIGEQSEQVRQLQQQLLEKETEQLRLMQELQRAQELPQAVSDGEGAGAVTSTTVSQLALAAPGAENAVGSSSSAALSEEVKLLRSQLEEARVAASAALEAQRTMSTERLEQAQTELRDSRLRAEDEYDNLTSTIEGLTRELADTKEALRVKEVSLRIALRESSPALVMAAASLTPSSGQSAPHPGATPRLVSGSSAASPDAPQPPLPRPLLLLSGSPGSSIGGRRSGTPPSPLASPPPPLEDTAAVRRDRVSSSPYNGEGSTDQPPVNRGKFFDDGTLRTLPSLMPMESEAAAGTHPQDEAAQLLLSTTTTTYSSRGKSSRGLTTSTGAASHTTVSLPRERSGSSSSNGHAAKAPRVPSHSTTDGAAASDWGSGAALLDAFAPLREPYTTPSSPSADTTNTRRGASARTTDRAGSEEGEERIPLPLPLRSPLFRSPPSSSSSSSAAVSPEERLRRFLTSATVGASVFESDVVDAVGVSYVRRPAAASPTPARHTEAAWATQPAEEGQRGAARPYSLNDGGVTPERTPLSLLSERTPASVGSTPSSGFGGSPHVREVAARLALTSLRRHREVWQQQASLLQSLQGTPSS